MKVCGKCGKKFPDEYMFCMECGSELGRGVTKPRGKQVPSRGKEKAGKAKPTPAAARPKRRRWKFTWVGCRRGLEAFVALFGLSLLAGGSFLARGSMGSTPNLELLILPAVVFVAGAVLAVLALLWADAKVRAIGGHAFAAVGVGLLIFSLMTAYERMGAPPQPANAPWLALMMAIGVFTILRGISLVRELGTDSRKAWGNVLAAVGFISLLSFVFAVLGLGLAGRVPGWENLTWLAVMLSIGGFLMWRGFPLALEYERRTREVWGGIFVVAGVSIFICIILLVRDMSHGTIERVDLVWPVVLGVVGGFLLAWGFWRMRK